MIRFLLALITLTGLLVGAASAQGEPPRIALVIGNSDYQTVPALQNPTADARLIGETLIELGFDVMLGTNTDQATLLRAIRDFGSELRAAGPEAVGLFYYAGHGLQAEGVNYLVPVDAVLENEADIGLSAVSVDGVLEQLNSAGNAMNIIVLDACRNNPFEMGNRAVSRGLATIDAPPGTYIAFSTAPGDVALDGRGDNSPFTMALAEAILMPGMPIEQMFKQVRRDVVQETGGEQTPWDSSSLLSDFSFVPPAEEAEHAAETEIWTAVMDNEDARIFEAFLRAYPDSMFANLARAKISEITAPEPAPAEVAATPDNQFTFDLPVFIGEPAIDGATLGDLVTEGVPSHTPLEGLEAAVWQQPCAACHKWTQAEFCTEAKRLAVLPDLDTRLHPFGAIFKRRMVEWAASGCP